mmetsp:Transcript_10753/g.20289  ORF Transcript_10753/g.20289 Transcript_10753/m.20289 type:complete len:328 (+) Transcript_10753:315-1298(+)
MPLMNQSSLIRPFSDNFQGRVENAYVGVGLALPQKGLRQDHGGVNQGELSTIPATLQIQFAFHFLAKGRCSRCFVPCAPRLRLPFFLSSAPRCRRTCTLLLTGRQGSECSSIAPAGRLGLVIFVRHLNKRAAVVLVLRADERAIDGIHLTPIPPVSVPRERSTVVVLDVSHLLIQRGMQGVQRFQVLSDEPAQVLPPVTIALEEGVRAQKLVGPRPDSRLFQQAPLDEVLETFGPVLRLLYLRRRLPRDHEEDPHRVDEPPRWKLLGHLNRRDPERPHVDLPVVPALLNHFGSHPVGRPDERVSLRHGGRELGGDAKVRELHFPSLR